MNIGITSLINRYSQLLIGQIKVEKKDKKDKEMEVESRKYHIIAIASGKGGVGKTTIAANLGATLSKLNKKVFVIDMDLAMPNLEIITGLKSPPVGLIDVLEGRLEIEQVIYIGPMGTKIIPPGIMLDGYSKEDNREKIIKLFRSFPIENDYIILDMPPGREAVDVLFEDIEALLVINPDKASILDAINMKALLGRKGVNIIGAILNRSEHDLELIDEIERVLETKILAVIPDSKIVKDATNNEECFAVTKRESDPSKELMELANEIVGNK
jgi:septum site-determining protein MinD